MHAFVMDLLSAPWPVQASAVVVAGLALLGAVELGREAVRMVRVWSVRAAMREIEQEQRAVVRKRLERIK